MKKLGLLSSVLAVGALAGCMGGGKKSGDDAAIEAAKQATIAQVSRQTGLFVDTPTEIGRKTAEEWQNDYLFLTTHQTVMDEETGKTSVVDIEWTWESDAAIRNTFEPDETHKCVYFNYSKTEDITFKFSANFTAGDKKSSTPNNYEVTLMHQNIEFKTVKIKELYDENDAHTGLKLVDYDNKEGYYYKKNNDNFKYACYEIYGQVVYTAPDGNWALIADGDYVLQLFSGSALNLKTSYFPDLVVGKTVRVWGEAGSFWGNVQSSFIFDIYGADSSKAAAPTAAKTISGSTVEGKHYWEGYLMNSLAKVTLTDLGNFRIRNSQTGAETATTLDAVSSGKRLLADGKVDGVTVTVAYDYHVEDADSNAIQKKLIEKLKTGSVTVTGTLRFVGPKNDAGFKGNESATSWHITPYSLDHIA